MPRGTLEVLLVGAKALEDTDFLNGMDQYAILTIRSQVKKSTVASGMGSGPEWNETFLFTISEGVEELLAVADHVPLEALFAEGTIPVTAYNVVKDQAYKGELKLGLNFTPEENGERGY